MPQETSKSGVTPLVEPPRVEDQNQQTRTGKGEFFYLTEEGLELLRPRERHLPPHFTVTSVGRELFE